ncbi:xyloglucan endotransglucosylase/hydrolase protein 2-like isoform X1 [Olea europaea var. sylvestris]|uniref:xyloglucan endotransglucosylase/hydrolase protein 2-like isoform X1 n=1 Tax=Olea europaea var. sylvestris TaxID=158386 RepID=UPI000C1D6B23|nr:xyloglucan endotransglucosylase/hydrolase protein 2-like isoform X1 [Olea europaea var. sylvestris]
MDYNAISLFLILFVACGYADETPFDENYSPMWGGDHVIVLDQGKEVELLIDEHSGAGFKSKQDFGSGYFRMMMKLPSNNSKGVITTFYLTSVPVVEDATNHDELDFEFLGDNDPMAYKLNTNVFANDNGHREQQFSLWFDPTTDFHMYELVWNQHQIVFFIDGIPIRVFRNNTKKGVSYPSKSMRIEASIWNSTAWVGPVDWSQGPFIAHYQGFSIDGCKYNDSDPEACYSMTYYWNAAKYWKLSPYQQRCYQEVRDKFMVYDYCTKNPENFPECLTDFPVEEHIQEDMNNMGFNNCTVNHLDLPSNSGGVTTSTLRKGAASSPPAEHDFHYRGDGFGSTHGETDKGFDILKTSYGHILEYIEDGEDGNEEPMKFMTRRMMRQSMTRAHEM